MPVLLPDEIDVHASFDALMKAGTMLGSAGMIVMDDTTCMVWACHNLLHFYRHESCGKCTPCREGGDWLFKLLWKIERGEGRLSDLDLLMNVANNIAGKTLCPFGDAAAAPVLRRSSSSAASSRRTFGKAAARVRPTGGRKNAVGAH